MRDVNDRLDRIEARLAAEMPARREPLRPIGLHELDYAEWSRQQAAALRQRDPAGLDWDNLADEVERGLR